MNRVTRHQVPSSGDSCCRAGGLIRIAAVAAILMGGSVWAACSPAVVAPVPEAALPEQADARVVLFMLDGVRRRDLFGRPEPKRVEAELNRLVRAAAEGRRAGHRQSGGAGRPQGIPTAAAARAIIAPDRPVFEALHSGPVEPSLVYGRPESSLLFYSANSVMKSLPAYQSIFAGFGTPCFSNACGPVQRETFFGRLRRNDRRFRVGAAVASWTNIADALRSEKDASFVNAGEGWFPEISPAHRAINDRYASPTHWRAARLDEQTFAHGETFLREKRPDFLFLSLNDADEWAHLNRYTEYVQTLRMYDRYLASLVRILSDMQGENWLFVTTDHGRGPGARWTNHGYELRAASVWLLVFGPLGRGRRPPSEQRRDLRRLPPTPASRVTVRTHLDLRPTVELLLGVPVQSCPLCGRPLPEVVELARLWRRADRTGVARKGAETSAQRRRSPERLP